MRRPEYESYLHFDTFEKQNNKIDLNRVMHTRPYTTQPTIDIIPRGRKSNATCSLVLSKFFDQVFYHEIWSGIELFPNPKNLFATLLCLQNAPADNDLGSPRGGVALAWPLPSYGRINSY